MQIAMQNSRNIYKIDIKSAKYPDLLREIASPPNGLHVIGELKNRPLVAIVGSRRPTEYGDQITYQLASELASAGVGIVSGLALGIDAIAHTAAIEAGGYTVAVMGCGLNDIYPSRNRGLARKIVESGGALISEYAPGVPALRHHFPARNRLIAGMSLATIVTEADEKSGSLITATFALEQNRRVMAVPGNITSRLSAGPNGLLRRGAIPIIDSIDVLNELNLETINENYQAPVAGNAEEAKLLDLLNQGVSKSQDLITKSGFSASQFAYTISLMEISGKVRNLGTGIWVKR